MVSNKKDISLPWDYIIDKIFKEYGSKDFYSKYRKGWYKFSPEVTSEWRKVYMNGCGVVHQNELFVKLTSWKPLWEKKFKDIPISFETMISHVLPICAPLFFEQEKWLTEFEKLNAIEVDN